MRDHASTEGGLELEHEKGVDVYDRKANKKRFLAISSKVAGTTARMILAIKGESSVDQKPRKRSLQMILTSRAYMSI